MQIDLIINRRARMLKSSPTLARSLGEIARGCARTHVTDSEEDLASVTAEIAKKGTDLVLLCGGDGSLMAGATALRRAFPEGSMPAISPIPAGTVGTIARNWGLSGRPEARLRRLLDDPHRQIRRPSLLVTERHAPSGERTHDDAQDSTVVERVGFIVGTGLVARFFRHYYALGAPGYAGSAKLVLRIFAESFVGGPLAKDVLDPMPCRLTVDGSLCEPQAWSLICCSVVPNLGIHMLLNYRAGEDMTRPHLVATPMPPHQLGPRAPWVLAGKSIGGAALVDDLVEGFSVAFPGPDPGHYVLDGELLSAASVSVSAGPILSIATGAAP